MNRQAPPRNGLRLVERLEPIEGKVPPHNLDAEAAVLSACLLNRHAVDLVLDLLVPEHFYSDANGKIYEAIRALAIAGEDIDIIHVANYLRDREQMGQVGGSTYLAQISDATPAIAHVRSHAGIVEELSRRRVLIATLHRCLAHGYIAEGLADPHYCDRVAAAVQKAATSTSRVQAVSIGTATEEAMIDVKNESESEGTVIGLPTGYPGLDGITGGLHPKELTFIGAPRKTGKSSLARSIAVHVARTPRLRDVPMRQADGCEGTEQKHVPQGVAMFSLEMMNAEIARDIACTQGGVDNTRLKTKTADSHDFTRLFEAAQWIADLPIRLVGDRRITALQLRGQLRGIHAEFTRAGVELALVIVDTVQLLVANEEKQDNELDEQVTDRVGRSLGQLAIDFDVPVLALTQLNAAGEARGSRALEMHAHNFWKLVVHRNKPADGYMPGASTTPVAASVKIAFQRHGAEDVEAPLWFTPAYTLFQDGSGQQT